MSSCQHLHSKGKSNPVLVGQAKSPELIPVSRQSAHTWH